MASGGANGEDPKKVEKTEEEKIRDIIQLDHQISNSYKEFADFSDLSSGQKNELKQNYQKRKESLLIQYKELKELKDFPDNVDDIYAMYDWIRKNSEAIVLLNNDDLRGIINDKELEDVERSTRAVRNSISRWFGTHRDDIENLSTKSEKVKETKEKKYLKEEFKNLKEYSELGAFAEKLSSAGNAHDKSDYKRLKKMLAEASSGRSITELFPNDKADLAKMDDAQKTALPYFCVKAQIENYIAHKAKDGVNAKDLKKLAAVEELNRYVSKKIKSMKFEPFKFRNTTFDKAKINETYQDEYESALKADSKLCDTSRADYLYDDLAKQYNKVYAGKSYVDAAILKNASSCMDRIMLKAQIDKKELLDKIPSDVQEADKRDFVEQKILKDFSKIRDKLIDSPIAAKKAPVKGKTNNDLNGPHI